MTPKTKSNNRGISFLGIFSLTQFISVEKSLIIFLKVVKFLCCLPNFKSSLLHPKFKFGAVLPKWVMLIKIHFFRLIYQQNS